MKALNISTGADGSLRVEAGVDSAVLRPGEPVFVPEGGVWNSFIVPSVRIGRLGMCISAKAAPAYIDGWTLFHVLKPAEPIAGVPWTIIDRTFSPGAWQPFGPDEYDRTRQSTVVKCPISMREDSTTCETEFSLAGMGVNEAISRFSAYCTLRTGDVLLFHDYALALGEAEINTEIKATAADGIELLKIRIK